MNYNKKLDVIKYVKEVNDEPCPSCHEIFKDEEDIIITKCSHKIHKECAEIWFEHHSECPQCKESVF